MPVPAVTLRLDYPALPAVRRLCGYIARIDMETLKQLLAGLCEGEGVMNGSTPVPDKVSKARLAGRQKALLFVLLIILPIVVMLSILTSKYSRYLRTTVKAESQA